MNANACDYNPGQHAVRQTARDAQGVMRDVLPDYPTPMPQLAERCPAHPFEAEHDVLACQAKRVRRAVGEARMAIGSGLTDEERRWVVNYIAWRAWRRDNVGQRAPCPTHGPNPWTGLIRLGCLIFGCCAGPPPFDVGLVEASGWLPGSPEHMVLTRAE